jgi:two-component system NtrC family sensor kinase
LSRKGAKSGIRVPVLRSNGTKRRARVGHTGEPAAELEKKLAEALEQRAATSEILRVISTSPTDVRPVFETIVRKAVCLCGSLFANVFRFDGELLHFVAGHNVGPSYVELLRAKYPMRPDFSQVSGRVLLTKSVVRLEDVLADPDYDQRFPQAMGWRRMLGVPMLRDGNALGVIVVGWAEAGPVSKAQEELLTQFADQAVIAIENVRLFDDVQARTHDLSESLERQTATSEVLQVISSSPGELAPVFHTIVENALRLCQGKFGSLYRYDGEAYHAMAILGLPSELAERLQRGPARPGRGTAIGRIAATKQVVHILDLPTQPMDEGDRELRAVAEQLGIRTILGVPMLKDGTLLGAMIVYRQEAQPFAQADRAADELRTSGRHRDREHAAAQRAARIATAADRHCRRAQGHQPLDVRFADRARYTRRIGCTAV